MEPFHQIFPKGRQPIMTLVLIRKTGTIPKGTYSFIECYCTEPSCDCRRVTLLVVNEKMRQKAAICFGFDQQGPFAGPYLDTSNPQSRYAPELLEFFVDSLNAGPGWLDRLYRQYRAVRKKIDGAPYRGKPLPKHGKLLYRVMPPPDLEAEMAQSLLKLRGLPAGPHPGDPGAKKTGRPARTPLSEGRPPAAGFIPIAKGAMASLVAHYATLGTGGSVGKLLAIQDELQDHLLANERAGDELASLLPVLCQQSPEDNEQIDAALRLLFDMLDVLQAELERHRPGARRRMELLQSALARHIYLENEDLDLCAAVSNTLLQSRVEILPVLREANTRMMQAGAARSDLRDLPGEEIMAGISRSVESMGLSSPFEGVQAILQLFALNEPQMQTALIGEMLCCENAMLREISALMLFHPEPEVRLGVSLLLSALDGRCVTPETLRRLIVFRNWFPENIRKNVDQAISNARKARVECAPLAKAPVATVHASSIDGAGAQSFQVIISDDKGFTSCSILLKEGVGVADSFLVALKSKRELADFLAMLQREGGFIDSSLDYLNLRVCHALAQGVSLGNAPGHWLVRIAELLGSDRWKAAASDAADELSQLREELAAGKPELLTDKERLASLEESAYWVDSEGIFSSWFEDDDLLDREIEASRGKRRSIIARDAVRRIVEVLLEKRRALWLERLVWTTLWLKNSRKAPVAWHRMYHVARAVADENLPLAAIPMMVAIARLSFEAHLERARIRRLEFGETK
jgi:hypothetical protein